MKGDLNGLVTNLVKLLLQTDMLFIIVELHPPSYLVLKEQFLELQNGFKKQMKKWSN